jgi:hypothetical protein
MPEAKDVLAQLKDIHLPPPIYWWPLAPGWYVLFTLSVFLIIALAYFAFQKIRNGQAKKQALRLLSRYQSAYEKNHNTQETSAQISELLKRVALVYFPRIQVASLHGQDWLNFLNQTSRGMDFNSVQDMLLDLPFKPSQPLDLTPLFQKTERWIKQRRRPCSN